MSIDGDIMRVAKQLRHMPGIDINKLAYLVSDDEWNRLAEVMHSCRREVSDSAIPIIGMSVMELEVRKRT